MAYHAESRPVIGHDGVVGAGAEVLGSITIGKYVVIGANAVVTSSLPDKVVVGGVPARILRSIDSDLEGIHEHV